MRFEVFLQKFQYEQPVIHVLYSKMIEMIRAGQSLPNLLERRT